MKKMGVLLLFVLFIIISIFSLSNSVPLLYSKKDYSNGKEKWSFVKKYAPLVYLHSAENFFPSSIDYHLENTIPTMKDGNLWAFAKGKVYESKTSGIFDVTVVIQNFFYGKKPTETFVPESYAIVIPEEGQDPLWAIENPHESNLRVVYFTFYPYNWGKDIPGVSMRGNHVGDIEKCYITFKKAIPQEIHCAAHSENSETEVWKDAKLHGTHPIVYSAKGSHGLYFSEGKHQYKNIGITKLTDYTDKGTPWKTWKNLRVILPDQFHKITSKASGWENIKIFNDIFRWGNSRRGGGNDWAVIEDGPLGFLDKGEVKDLLNKFSNNTCKGNNVFENCQWPIGRWSGREVGGIRYITDLSSQLEGCLPPKVQWAYDSNAQIGFCSFESYNKKTELVATDVVSIHHGNCQVGYKKFAWNGQSNISFCWKAGNIRNASHYIGGIDAVLHKDGTCNDIMAKRGRGLGWSQFAYDGQSKIRFCVRYIATNQQIGYITDITSTLGQCSQPFTLWAYDGNSKISFCKIVSKNPNMQNAIVDVKSIHHGKCPDGYKQFAWNGKSSMTFCYKKSNVGKNETYVKDLNATKERCESLGIDWTEFAFDGQSNIRYCAQYAIKYY